MSCRYCEIKIRNPSMGVPIKPKCRGDARGWGGFDFATNRSRRRVIPICIATSRVHNEANNARSAFRGNVIGNKPRMRFIFSKLRKSWVSLFASECFSRCGYLFGYPHRCQSNNVREIWGKRREMSSSISTNRGTLRDLFHDGWQDDPKWSRLLRWWTWPSGAHDRVVRR